MENKPYNARISDLLVENAVVFLFILFMKRGFKFRFSTRKTRPFAAHILVCTALCSKIFVRLKVVLNVRVAGSLVLSCAG